MYRMFCLFILAILAGCQPQDVSLEEMLDAQYLRGDVSESSQEVVLEFDSELGDVSYQDAGATTVRAWICVVGVCGWGEGVSRGNTLTITLPNDPALIGLTVTAWVPSTGRYYEGVVT